MPKRRFLHVVRCLRCDERLEFQGAHVFQQANKWPLLGGIGEMLVREFKASVYACPNCGHMELFHPTVGLEARQRKDDA